MADGDAEIVAEALTQAMGAITLLPAAAKSP